MHRGKRPKGSWRQDLAPTIALARARRTQGSMSTAPASPRTEALLRAKELRDWLRAIELQASGQGDAANRENHKPPVKARKENPFDVNRAIASIEELRESRKRAAQDRDAALAMLQTERAATSQLKRQLASEQAKSAELEALVRCLSLSLSRARALAACADACLQTQHCAMVAKLTDAAVRALRGPGARGPSSAST